MKGFWNSFKIAFSMYSKIPMPYAEWRQENMRYSMCFFPFVGVVIGIVVWLWSKVLTFLPFEHQFGTAIYVLLPVLITGGIHFDGFLDTMDALNSHQSKERKLEILKDPHTGAFAIIAGILYFVVAFGIWSEVDAKATSILAVGFVLSRALSGFSVVTFKMAKNSGLAATFSESAAKKRVRLVMIFYIIACIGAMFWLQPNLAIAAVTAAALVFGYYRFMSEREFGGITGDLAGYFLQVCELGMAIAVIVTERFLACR